MIKQLSPYPIRELEIEKKLYVVLGDHNKTNDTPEVKRKF